MSSGPLHGAARRRAVPRPASRPWTERRRRSSPSSRPTPTRWPCADELDRERAAKGARGPLHGIPVLLKDNIDTADRMTTTAGSLALEGSIAPRDAHVAERLRRGRRRPARQGQPERVGQHPLDPLVQRLERARRAVPQSVRARPQPLRLELGLGGGGLRQLRRGRGRHRDRRLDRLPGVGQRRRRDQADRRAGEPRGHHPDLPHAGHRRPALPHGGRRGGAARARWPAPTRAIPRRRAPPGTSRPTTPRSSTAAGSAARASAWPASKFFGYSDATDRLAEAALERAAARGRGRWWTRPTSRTPATYDDAELEVLLYELKADLNAYLATLGPTAPVRTLADVIAFNERRREREMPYFGQELFVQAEAKGPLTTPGVPEGARRPAAGWRATPGSTRSWPSTGWTPSSRRPAIRRGPPTS